MLSANPPNNPGTRWPTQRNKPSFGNLDPHRRTRRPIIRARTMPDMQSARPVRSAWAVGYYVPRLNDDIQSSQRRPAMFQRHLARFTLLVLLAADMTFAQQAGKADESKDATALTIYSTAK